MMPFLPSTSPMGDAGSATIGPVMGHRIAQIRRRIRQGRYALDSRTLASEVALHERNDRLTDGVIRTKVEQMLSAAIGQLDYSAMLILQLEFVEQLTAPEIAVTVGASASALASSRQAALLKLKCLLDAG